MNKYYNLLKDILKTGKEQKNKKGNIKYLINKVLSMDKADVLRILEEHPIAKKKLSSELKLYCKGITSVKDYNEVGITWWDYCKPEMVNTYPKYFKKLPELINKINSEKRKSTVLFLNILLDILLKWFAPILSFTTEEIYSLVIMN